MPDPQTSSRLSAEAAETIRSLNHVTLGYEHPDWEHPSDACSVIGGLELLAAYLPQTLGQIGMFLSRLDNDGHMGSTTSDADQDIVRALSALSDARMAAIALARALQDAHKATSPLTYKD